MTKIAVLCRSLGRRCGIGEYSQLLARRLDGIAVGSVSELPRDVEIVLIQYEPLLYEGSADIVEEVLSIDPTVITVVDAHNIYPNEAAALRWYAIVGTKRGFHPGTLRLSLCLPEAAPAGDAAAPSEIRLGAFGFAFPGKRYEIVIELAKRLDVPATILAAHNNATPELSELSSSYLAQLRELAGNGIEVVDEFLPEEEVIRRLRHCSHLISAMDDNLSQSASMRTMVCAGRPIISLKTDQAYEVGAVLVDNFDAVTLEFLQQCGRLPHVYDGIADYQALIASLERASHLQEQIQHPDKIYLDDARQMERLVWLKEQVHGRAIDVGIGSGFSTNYVRAVSGVEIRPDRLEYASVRYPHIDFRLLDARVQALAGFDTVVLAEIIEHMPHADARQMLSLWAESGAKRILVTTPNAAKEHYDDALVHNPEHIWEPTEELVQALVPAGYRSTTTLTAEGDFILLEMEKVASSRKGRPTKDQQIEALVGETETLQRLANEREVYAVSLRKSEQALQDRVKDLDEQLAVRHQAQEAAQERIRVIEEERGRLAAERSQLAAELQSVLGSKIWRVTSPLRKIASRLRAPSRGGTIPLQVGPSEAAPLTEAPRGAEIAACTIVSKNYLAQARVLAESFKKHHPDAAFYVLLADRPDGYFNPEDEPMDIVDIDELDIPHAERFRFRYRVIEHDTAVKPYLLSHLLGKVGVNKVIYFDPDILVLHDLSNVFSLLDAYSIVLTPHITAPIKDEFEPNEITILKAGVYNLGFIAVSNTPTSREFLSWWQERLYDRCFEAPESGLHVDQRWIDLVPGMFDGVHILKHPGYNVAFWNLSARRVQLRDGQVMVTDQPCYFFHFSGLNPDDLRPVSKHQNRFTFDKLERDAQRLFERYAELLLSAGYRESIKWPYAFGAFDNGAKIPDLARALYSQFGDEVARFGNPFETGPTNSFFNWLNGSYDGQRDPKRIITRLWFEIYRQRPDLQRAYPDIFGPHRTAFLQWISNSGPREHDIDERFVVHELDTSSAPRRSRVRRLARAPKRVAVALFYLLKPTLKPALKATIGRNDRVWHKLQRIRDRLILGSPPPPAGIEAPFGRRLHGLLGGAAGNGNGLTPPFGVNVAGYLTSEKGTGEAARSAINILQAEGIPVALNNIIDSGSENVVDAYADFDEGNPYAFNLIFVNADQATNFAWHKGEEYFRGRYTIGVWNWELTTFPPEWLTRFQYYDEIWVATDFVRDALAPISPIPIVKIPYALEPNPVRDSRLKRSRFNILDSQFMFLFMFDFHSVLERKNPKGLIEAFKRAFPVEDDVTLLIKSSHADQKTVAAMREAAKGTRIHVVDTVLTREEIAALYKLSDCYVSLHRSEGFGLTLAEAMLAGKPTIGTAYGGNVDFMTPENSYLVKYAVTQIDRDYTPYKKGWSWADPDLHHAAELMRQVYENRDEASAVGRRAREDIVRLLNPHAVGEQMKQRLKAIASHHEITIPESNGARDRVQGAVSLSR